MINAVLVGASAAVMVFGLFVLIGHLAKTKLERWSYDLNRETHHQLHEADLKLDTIAQSQERLLAQMERLLSTGKTSLIRIVQRGRKTRSASHWRQGARSGRLCCL
jgi:hypothetical protein